MTAIALLISHSIAALIGAVIATYRAYRRATAQRWLASAIVVGPWRHRTPKLRLSTATDWKSPRAVGVRVVTTGSGALK